MTDPKAGEPDTGPDIDAVRRFIERFAVRMEDAGWQRMPARVFGALLASEDGALTAAELAEVLQVSPAAISGAVRNLVHLHMAAREREPGSRRDVYRVRDNVWEEVVAGRESTTRMFQESLYEGVRAVGADTRAGRRLNEGAEFFAFMQREAAEMIERWLAYRKTLRAAD
ncbi:GbsR/MarR family transcriptional regulator [Actinomadura parmotrematis]|uniref:MarR family transcriptional regulator n=1 Tax=Actinomadura parmotrematis TaxID=2864039 RepID=A0ABS7G0C8_9ACTN|nr:MarR family transcriptional regulator [Actinomadura parmotrematis]MBW8486163.1 MarR family transcriptional regulator [Actinomadura parmotrematis]